MKKVLIVPQQKTRGWEIHVHYENSCKMGGEVLGKLHRRQMQREDGEFAFQGAHSKTNYKVTK